MVKKQDKTPPVISTEMVPHLYNQQMLAWQRAIFEALREIYKELQKLNKEKGDGIS